jgi:hypothetical protein
LLQVATRHGAGHRELASACVAILSTQVLPGALVWRALRPRGGWWIEDAVLGLAVGAALAVPAQILSVALSAPWLAWACPVALAGCLLGVRRTRRRILTVTCAPLPLAWGTSAAVASLLTGSLAVGFFADAPLRWSGWAVPYVDLPYHLALVGEVANRFPPHYPQLAGERLYYHWFSHSWTAQVASVSGAPHDVVLVRLLPLLLAVAVPVATAAVAMRVSRLVWAGPLAAAVAFALPGLDVWRTSAGGLPIAPLSPSQGFGVLVLLPTLGLLAVRWSGSAPPASLAVLVLLVAVAGGAKGAVLPVLVCGCLLATASALVWRHALWRRVALDTAVAAVVLLVLIRVLFAGGDGGTVVDPLTSIAGGWGRILTGSPVRGPTLLIVVTLLVFWSLFAGSVGALGVLERTPTRQDPVVWLLFGCSLAGAGAVVVLSHPGAAHWYFLRTAEVPLSIVAAWGTVLIVKRTSRPPVAVGGGVLGAVAAVGATWWWVGPIADSSSRLFSASLAVAVFGVVILAAGLFAAILASADGGARVRMVLATGVVALTAAAGLSAARMAQAALTRDAPRATAETPGSFSSAQVQAARYIRDHAAPDELVMTNRHCRGQTFPGCDVRRFFVAAYTEHGVLIEGWAYTRRANALAAAASERGDPRRVPFWDAPLLALNDRFVTQPSAHGARRLYELGVRWVFIDPQAPHARSLAPYAVERLRNDAATVYRLRPTDPPQAGSPQ